ncbi:hypothetical protein [Pandoravirus japonicus]|uniref:Uncharacterized protein n=1 Tax=Pandoravirus japonicus TaxID=2823154 RepID=A0A811BM92_9VIRU|nr:hypothetical protein [Pandoravirus japonicus]
MSIANGSATHQRQRAPTLFQATGVDPDVAAGTSRIRIVKSDGGRPSAPRDIIERARAFLATPSPLPVVDGVRGPFAIGFFCQTRHLVSWGRLLKSGIATNWRASRPAEAARRSPPSPLH